ncbi:hypothetical protein BDD12DRAFT_899886 [Trichophaea hybrida]|nr:hypothetical protein BDD12DRAFT_899886 [Trichophaea hybrida]
MPRNKGKKHASAPTPPKPYTTRDSRKGLASGSDCLALLLLHYEDNDCDSEQEWQSESEFYDHETDDDEGTVAFSYIEALRGEFKCSLHKLESEMLAKIAIIPSKIWEFQRQTDKTINEMEMKLRSSEQILTKNASDITILRAKNTKEEQKVAAATQVVTPPTTPRKEISIRQAPPKAPTRVVTPLAQQVLKRNMAKRKERSGSEAMDTDTDNDSAPITGRPVKAPRQLSPTPNLEHLRNATEVDKEK